jgi:hypothetical protein
MLLVCIVGVGTISQGTPMKNEEINAVVCVNPTTDPMTCHVEWCQVGTRYDAGLDWRLWRILEEVFRCSNARIRHRTVETVTQSDVTFSVMAVCDGNTVQNVEIADDGSDPKLHHQLVAVLEKVVLLRPARHRVRVSHSFATEG